MSESLAVQIGSIVRKSVDYDTKVERDLSALYPRYIAEHGVTLATVGAHVKAMREEQYPGVQSDPKADKASKAYKAHTFSCRIRNGLNRELGKKSKPSEALVTPLGAQSSLDAVIEAWTNAQK